MIAAVRTFGVARSTCAFPSCLEVSLLLSSVVRALLSDMNCLFDSCEYDLGKFVFCRRSSSFQFLGSVSCVVIVLFFWPRRDVTSSQCNHRSFFELHCFDRPVDWPFVPILLGVLTSTWFSLELRLVSSSRSHALISVASDFACCFLTLKEMASAATGNDSEALIALASALAAGETSVTLAYVDGFGSDLLSAVVAAITERPTAAARITELDLGGNHIDAALAPLLLPVLPALGGLSTLDLRDNRLGPEGWALLQPAIAKHCPRLTALDLSENQVWDKGARLVAVLLSTVRGLRSVSLSTNGLTPASIAPLLVGIGNGRGHLRALFLDYNALGDAGVVELCAGIASARLPVERIGLSDNGVGCRGAEAVALLLQAKGNAVAWLNLSVNQIGPVGAAALADALRSGTSRCRLEHLDLGNNPIGTAGAAALCGSLAAFPPTLALLDLCSCGLTNADFEAMRAQAALPGFSVRTVVWFNNPGVSLEIEQATEAAIRLSAQRLDEEANIARQGALARRNGFVLVGSVVAALGLLAVVANRWRNRL